MPGQKRIAAILDKADALRRKRQQALQLTEQFLRSTFLDMFGDPEMNPKRWPVLPFGELAENRDARRIPLKESDRDKRHGCFPYYGSVGIIDFVDDFLFDGEHLLISEDGKHLESRNRPVACLASDRFWVNNHAHVLASNGRADLFYLAHHMEMRDLSRFVTGIDQFKLNRCNLDQIPVPVPPVEFQMRFRMVRDFAVNIRARTQTAVQSTDDLFHSLVQRAFRGEL